MFVLVLCWGCYLYVIMETKTICAYFGKQRGKLNFPYGNNKKVVMFTAQDVLCNQPPYL